MSLIKLSSHSLFLAGPVQKEKVKDRFNLHRKKMHTDFKDLEG